MYPLFIYTKQVMNITGKSERYSRVILNKIKAHYNKEEHQLVTVEEYCKYMGVTIEQIKPYLK
jgi:lipocalin